MKHKDQNGDDPSAFPSRTEEEFSPHHHIIYSCRKMPFPLSPRDFLHRGVWKKLDEDTFMLGYKYCEDNDLTEGLVRASARGVVRAEFQGIYYFERTKANHTKLTYIAKADVKGMIPSAIANTGVSGMVETVNRAQAYFAPQEWEDCQDGGTGKDESKCEETPRDGNRK